jgi:hypothetical protein
MPSFEDFKDVRDDLSAYYFLNLNELACSDLDQLGSLWPIEAHSPLQVDSKYPYRSKPSKNAPVILQIPCSVGKIKKWAHASYGWRIDAIKNGICNPAKNTPAILEIPCPVCKATVGHRCRTVRGDGRIDRTTHKPRYCIAYGLEYSAA